MLTWFTYLVKVVSATFLYWKVSTFPLLMNKYLMSKYSATSIYPLINLVYNNYCGINQIKIFIFIIPSYIYQLEFYC
jgi:hypothetical protein